jgi:hypothetical protein
MYSPFGQPKTGLWIFGVLIEASILTQYITLIEKLNLFISRHLSITPIYNPNVVRYLHIPM